MLDDLRFFAGDKLKDIEYAAATNPWIFRHLLRSALYTFYRIHPDYQKYKSLPELVHDKSLPILNSLIFVYSLMILSGLCKI